MSSLGNLSPQLELASERGQVGFPLSWFRNPTLRAAGGRRGLTRFRGTPCDRQQSGAKPLAAHSGRGERASSGRSRLRRGFSTRTRSLADSPTRKSVVVPSPGGSPHPEEELDVTLTPLSLRSLSDDALLASLRALAVRDADLEADLLVNLGELDARELYLGQGYPSLFAWCTEVLHFSESIAYHRITAARTARAFPRVLDAVRSGELHLSAVRLLAPHLTRENEAELLDRAQHRGKRAIEAMLADRAPKPGVPAQVRRLPAPLPATRPGDGMRGPASPCGVP